jgi:hypothetical protein
MKLITLLLCAVCLHCEVAGHGVAGEPQTVTRNKAHETPGGELLNRIAQIESRGISSTIGRRGERGAFQIDLAAWTDISSVRRHQGLTVFDWSAAHTPAGRAYASTYLGMLRIDLTRALRRVPTDGELYAAYNLGFAGFARRGFVLARCPARTRAAAGLLIR